MTIRPIQSTDYEKVEQLIKDAILEINAKDYSKENIERMLEMDPYRPRATAQERDYFVATDGTDILGVIGMKENEVKTLFVDPTYHGQNIGTSLLTHIEKLIADNGYSVSNVYSSVSAKKFYEKQGYTLIKEDISENNENKMLRYYMEKKLS